LKVPAIDAFPTTEVENEGDVEDEDVLVLGR
jgi:hypothetical protein